MTSETVPITVQTASPPACTSTANPNMERKRSPSAHQCTGRCEKPTNAPTRHTRADQARQPDRRGVELEHDQREADDDQEVGDRRADQAVQQRVAEPEAVEHDVLVRLASAVLAGADHLGGRQLDRRPAAVVTVFPSSCTISSPTVGRTPLVAPTLRRRGRAEPHRGQLAARRRDHGRCAGRASASRSATARPGARVRVVEAHRLAGAGARAGRDEREVRGLQEDRGRALGVGARRPDPHGDRNARTLDGAHDLFDVGVDGARRLQLQDQQGRPVLVGLARSRRGSARRWARRGSPRPARRRCRAGRRAALPRRRPCRARATSTRRASDEQRNGRGASGARWGLP